MAKAEAKPRKGRRAERVAEHEIVTLNGRESLVFVEALVHTPEPGERLREAAARYNAVIGEV
ncbi:MAG TPA: DUF1778 domain-containing protein [Caulobacteraceae bacterium]|nr:DUF1778 domain-containing protein [Caulobacteraceae bacterium]